MIPSALLRQTATVEPYIGEGGAGPLFGEPVTYPVRVGHRHHWTNTPTGWVSISDAEMDMRPDAQVAVDARVTVGEIVYRAVDVTEIMGLTRPEYVKVILSRSTT